MPSKLKHKPRPKRKADTEGPKASDDENLMRFHQSHKRLKAAARSKDREISSLELALEASKIKEKDAVAKVAIAENLKLKWVKWWGEEMERASCLEREVNNLRTENPRDRAVEAAMRNRLEAEVASLEDTHQRSESEKVALQEQLSDMETKHKELLNKFNDYKKRMRKMGNEY